MESITFDSWSMVLPSGAGQLLHWCPYTGPRSPFSSAHSSQMDTPWSLRYLMLVSPEMNQRSSYMMDFRCTFLVVRSGNPAPRSKRIWYPKTLCVPTPVRSSFITPCSRMCRRRSRYCFICRFNEKVPGKPRNRVGVLFLVYFFNES